MATGWRSSYYRYKELFLNVSAVYKRRADLRAFLEIVLSIIAVIIFLLFALKPTALTIISLVKQIREERNTLSALNQKVSNLQMASTVLGQNQSYIESIETAVASAPTPDTFAKQIEGISAKNGTELISLTINEVMLVGTPPTVKVSNEIEPLPGNAYEMGYSANVRGKFSNIQSFLKDLENLRVISKVDSVIINSTTTSSERVIVAIVSGRIPYLSNQK